jgi:HNH endonuclease
MIERMFDTMELTGETVASWVEQLASCGGAGDDQSRVRLIGELERLACAARGLQADLAADLDDSVRRSERDRGVPAARQGRGVAGEVALARRESPYRGRQHVSLGRVLRDEMPCTRRAFRRGRITEWKAVLLARETACLSLTDRRMVDRRLAGDPDRLERLGDRELEAKARSLAGELDAAACVLRRRIAESQRRVTLRPAPDTMTRLSAELPVGAGVAVLRSLTEAADSARAAGDERTRGQVMADTLVERVLGTTSGVVPVEIALVVSDEVLLGTRDDAAHVDGFGPVPAELARELAVRATAAELATLRRLYRRSADGTLVAMDSRSRRFAGGLARFIRLRDQVCRVPWCDAPIRHVDHPEPVSSKGKTSSDNGQGLCEACNYAKEAPGWRVRLLTTDPHVLEIRTPSGQVVRSHAPPAPGRPPPGRGLVPRLDLAFTFSAA